MIRENGLRYLLLTDVPHVAVSSVSSISLMYRLQKGFLVRFFVGALVVSILNENLIIIFPLIFFIYLKIQFSAYNV